MRLLAEGKPKKRKSLASEEDMDPSWEIAAKKTKKGKIQEEELALGEQACFVQCEICGKWRLLPKGTHVRLGSFILLANKLSGCICTHQLSNCHIKDSGWEMAWTQVSLKTAPIAV